MTSASLEYNIVFFDGYCVLCNGLVDWLIKRDTQYRFKFASLQGLTAKQILGNEIKVDTIIYFRKNQKLEKSTAVLTILSDLQGAWGIAKYLLFIPPFIRDAIYGLVAKVRYSITGKNQTCRLPTQEEKQRILE